MRPGDRMRAICDFAPVDHLPRMEFYIWDEALERWRGEGLPADWQESNLFNYDPDSGANTGVDLGWCEPPFLPLFEEKVVESVGDYEVIQDIAGRLLKVFKGRRHGFMPEYVKHAVENMADWEAVAPRLDPNNAQRWVGLEERVRERSTRVANEGGLFRQQMIGGYMYLRALMGPEGLLYGTYDFPEVIHAAMQGWFDISDAGIARVQAVAEIDEIFMGEDICYNHGLLISPDQVREFLFPYYQQLLNNARARQSRPLAYQVDTDGDCRPAIPLYYELGMTRMSPFEVASCEDVVAIAKQYPRLVMHGGIDKRVLASGKDAIDSYLEYLMPYMVERGGFYPTCDHGVPDDVSLENYLHYRKRVCEMDH